MTEAQKRFVALERRKDEWKQFLAELKEANQAVADEVGVGGMFQDDEGVVYKVVVPKGKFVHFDEIDYVRTKRPDEKVSPHPLSMKEAEAAGFRV